MRWAFVLVAAAAGCGRLGFDAVAQSDGASVLADATDAMSPQAIALACNETKVANAAAIGGTALQAVVTTRGLAALWLDPGGALRGTTWKAAPGGVAVVEDAVAIAPGPFSNVWVAANRDEILVVTENGSSRAARLLREDLTPIDPAMALTIEPLTGREPLTPRRGGGPGFIAIASAAQPTIYEIDGRTAPVAHPLPALISHGLTSIAADSDGYAVVTEFADQFGPGCWYSKVSDAFAVTLGPGFLETTQQADCDSSTVSASAGPPGAGMAWMDRDPVSSNAEFRGTGGASGTASGPGEAGVGLPIVAATSTGFAVVYRSSLGVRVHDAAGVRTLAASAGFVDLVTWADRAIVVWTTMSGAAQLTRLCP